MVRMWAQTGDDAVLGEWRGSVADVESGVRVYVTGTRDVADFIAARMIVAREPSRGARATEET
jgi:hypothetical protein